MQPCQKERENGNEEEEEEKQPAQQSPSRGNLASSNSPNERLVDPMHGLSLEESLVARGIVNNPEIDSTEREEEDFDGLMT